MKHGLVYATFYVRCVQISSAVDLPLRSVFRYVSNFEKLVDEAPNDPSQDFKTQV